MKVLAEYKKSSSLSSKELKAGRLHISPWNVFTLTKVSPLAPVLASDSSTN